MPIPIINYLLEAFFKTQNSKQEILNFAIKSSLNRANYNPAIIKQLLILGADINNGQLNYTNIVQFFCLNNQYELLSLFMNINNNFDINQVSDKGYTPLHYLFMSRNDDENSDYLYSQHQINEQHKNNINERVKEKEMKREIEMKVETKVEMKVEMKVETETGTETQTETETEMKMEMKMEKKTKKKMKKKMVIGTGAGWAQVDLKEKQTKILKLLLDKNANINIQSITELQTPIHLLMINSKNKNNQNIKPLDFFSYIMNNSTLIPNLNIRDMFNVSPLELIYHHNKGYDILNLLLKRKQINLEHDNIKKIHKLDHKNDTKKKINKLLFIYESLFQDFKHLLKSEDKTDLIIKHSLKNFNLHGWVFKLRLGNADLSGFVKHLSNQNADLINQIVYWVYTGEMKIDDQSNEYMEIERSLNGLIRQNANSYDFNSFTNYQNNGINLVKKYASFINQKRNNVFDFLKHYTSINNEKIFNIKSGKSGLLFDLNNLFLDKKSMKFSISVKSVKINVHKEILFTRSNLFKGMFLNIDNIDSIMDYSGFEVETYKILIQFLYTESIPENLSNDILDQLLEAVEYFQLSKSSYLLFLIQNYNKSVY